MTSSTGKSPFLAERINSYLISAMQRNREVEDVCGFVASVDAEDSNPYRNYAVPSVAGEPSATDIADLIQWFCDRNRKPRLEYMGEAAPAVEAALMTAGFSIEGRLPLLTLNEFQLRLGSPPSGIEIAPANSEAQLCEAAQVQNSAYGSPDTTQADVDRLLRNLATGGKVLVAREVQSSSVVGAGLYSTPYQGVTEIAAIGVLSAFRRRGIATALTGELARSAFGQGIATAFLMAASEAEQRIYERAGFVIAGHIIHISLSE